MNAIGAIWQPLQLECLLVLKSRIVHLNLTWPFKPEGPVAVASTTKRIQYFSQNSLKNAEIGARPAWTELWPRNGSLPVSQFLFVLSRASCCNLSGALKSSVSSIRGY